MRPFATLAVAPFLLLAAGCSNLQYDLTGMPFSISALPAPPGTAYETFELRDSHVLWGYGLFGESQPDVAGLLQAECSSTTGVTDFRVVESTPLHAWLATHLTLGLVRHKVVTITGTKLRAMR
jgi:hypothetical protein